MNTLPRKFLSVLFWTTACYFLALSPAYLFQTYKKVKQTVIHQTMETRKALPSLVSV